MGQKVAERTQALNSELGDASARQVLKTAMTRAGRVALVSSFGAESVVLLHMAAQIDRNVPVLFLETEMLFPETLSYQREVATYLGLSNVQVIQPDRAELFERDPDGLLHRADTDACCSLRKTRPLQKALADYDGWITGRKRHQGQSRAELPFVENEAGKRLKFNPLANWPHESLSDYLTIHRLPRHPLVARGYRSVGCAPCTHPTATGQDPRAGRWAGSDKSECGIHFVDGKFVRGGTPTHEDA